MSPARKTPWSALLGATLIGALVAGFLFWQVELGRIGGQIQQKRSTLKKLVVSGRIPPNQDVMEYLTSRAISLEERYTHWEALAVVPLPTSAASSDPQLYFQERFHEVQRTLERLAAARALPTPEQLGFPKELPPSDTVPRLLVQLALIEDTAKLVLAQGVSSVASVKVGDPQTVLERESETPFLLRLPVRIRLSASLPVVVKVLGALQHAKPIIELQGIRISTGSVADELEVELVVSRYLLLAVPRSVRHRACRSVGAAGCLTLRKVS